MGDNNSELIYELNEMIKVLLEEHRQLMCEIHELKEEQKKIREEIKMSNLVLHNIGIRNEIVN